MPNTNGRTTTVHKVTRVAAGAVATAAVVAGMAATAGAATAAAPSSETVKSAAAAAPAHSALGAALHRVVDSDAMSPQMNIVNGPYLR